MRERERGGGEKAKRRRINGLLGRLRKEKAEKNNKIFVGSKEKTCLIAKGVESFIFFCRPSLFLFRSVEKTALGKMCFFLGRE